MPKLYQVILKGSYQNQLIINAPTFISSNETPATASAVGLARALGHPNTIPTAPQPDTFLEAFLAAQTTIYHLDEIMIRNLYDVNDFYTAALSGTGWAGDITVTDNGAISFLASKLQTNRVRQDIGRGSMALTPMSEQNYAADGSLIGGTLALLQAVCDRLNEPPSFTEGSDATDFIPCVISKEKRPVPNSNPVREAYYYYKDPLVQLDHVAVGVTWMVKDRATSQVSRKIGKGA